MNASVHWLSAFVDTGLSPRALRELLTARVATVDAVERVRIDLAGIVVARVVEAARHPDSDHLWVTRVDAGGPELLDVVCGAPNVTAGARYPFAPVGTTMPNGLAIERRKIRGRLSNGMLCSARELGLGTDHEGIMPLSVDAPPGTPLLDAMPIGDTRLVVDVLPNRPDLLSHLGLARELAAATGRPLRDPSIPGAPAPSAVVPSVTWAAGSAPAAGVRVTVEDPGDCPAFLGAVVRGVRIGPSPEWLVGRLATVGVRSVNNVVDVTNYMLHGYGQPMHAYDLRRLAGGEVRVRRARAGESIRTLDGSDRRLDPSMIVIADAERAQGIAGVIGGRESEISADTTDLFLEAASFAPGRVRAARRALGISTDASYRFERLVPAVSPAETCQVALRLLVALAGGEVAPPVALVGRRPERPAPITLRSRRVAQVLGVPIPAGESATLLRTIGFEATPAQDTIAVVFPWWRTDARTEIDLVEEVARLRGYDSVPDELRPYRLGTVPDDPLVARSAALRELLVGRGFLEIRPMPFVGPGAGATVRVTNPLADTESYLRPDLLVSLARRAEFNLARLEGNLRLFEIGTAFRAVTGSERPHEETRVAALCMGARRPPHFTEPEPPSWDEWDAKALAHDVAGVARPGVRVELAPDGGNGTLWRVLAGEGEADGAGAREEIGRVVRVSLDAPPWAAPAFGVEITVAATPSAPVAPPGEQAFAAPIAPPARGAGPRYRAQPSQPPVRVDVTLLVPDDVSAGAIERRLRASGDTVLERVELVSEYRGVSIPAGHRSLTWRLTFRHGERSLREKEVEARRDKLLRALESELGVRHRTT